MQRLRLVAFGLVAALLAVGCGSDKPETTAAWADGVCTAITTWQSSIKDAAGAVSSAGISKDSLQSAADDAKSATQTLQSDLKDLDQPNTPAGQNAKASVDQLSSDLQKDTASIKAAVDGVSGVSDVVAAASTVRTTLATMKNQLSTTLEGLQQDSADSKGELKTAFQQSTACQQLSGSSSSPTTT